MTEEKRMKIFKDAQTMSFGLVARRYGISRNAVAGLVFRKKNPSHTLIPSPAKRRAQKKVKNPYKENTPYGNMKGCGHHGRGPIARFNLWNSNP